MKRTRPWYIVVWVLLVAAGAGAVVVGRVMGWRAWLYWVPVGTLWSVTALWIVLHVIRGRRPGHATAPAAFADGNEVRANVLRQAREATAAYLGMVTDRGPFVRRALYARPWFLVLGPSGSGKSTCIERSGHFFPVSIPAQPAAAPRGPWEQVRWHFANEGVWIDSPGTLLDDAAQEQWRAVTEAFATVRPRRPVDGVLVVFSAECVRQADAAGVRTMADGVRRRLDELISVWEMEFPVYLVLTHTDKLGGFSEFFAVRDVGEAGEVLGITFDAQRMAESFRKQFAEDFRALGSSLAHYRAVRLARSGRDEELRRACRFTIEMLSLEEKLGVLAAELFRESSYVGRPIPGGVYFTGEAGVQAEDARSMPTPVSVTVAGHPLNPRRQAVTVPSERDRRQPALLFARPLLRMLMTGERLTARRTARQARIRFLRAVAVNGVVVLLAGLLIAALVAKRRNHVAYIGTVVHAVQQTTSAARLEDRYRTLDRLVEAFGMSLKRRGVGQRLAGARGGAVHESLAGVLARELRQLIATPAAIYLEREIGERTALPGELSAEAYDELYRLLRIYLLVSEAGSPHRDEINAAACCSLLREAVAQTVVRTLGLTRLPPEVEAAVNAAVPLYVEFVASGKCGLVQTDHRLVREARLRLRRVPGASALYRSVAARLASSVPALTLADVMERESPGVLVCGASISSIYTPEGFYRHVSAALTQAAGSRRPVDWVVGETESIAVGDSAALVPAMMAEYAADYRDQWLAFISAVRVQRDPGLASGARALRALMVAEGELETLLRRVKELTEVSSGGLAPLVGETAQKAQAALRDNVPLGGETAAKAVGTAVSRRGPFSVVAAEFGALGSLLAEGPSGQFTVSGYAERAALLAQRLDVLAGAPSENIVTVFSGRDDDPLLSAWRYTRKGLGELPPGIARALAGIFLSPLEELGAEVSQTLGVALNERWNIEVVKPFADRVAGRYPVARRRQEAAFGDVMDFFRPGAGVLWGFCDRVLAPYVIRESAGWRLQAPECLRLDFNPALAASLEAAQRIREVLFAPNGQERSLTFTIWPPARGRPAELEVCGVKSMLTPGGTPVRVEWPVRSPVQGARLSVQLPDGTLREAVFDGEWGFMRLMQSGTIQPVNRSTCMVTWKVNVQNIYTIEQSYRVEVNGGENPFGVPLFESFECPVQVVVRNAKL